MSKRSLEDLVKKSEIGTIQAQAHWRGRQQAGAAGKSPNALALARRAAPDMTMCGTAGRSAVERI
ncbi:hypothetical protein CXK94_17465 [Stutzerimonas stutzeri]|uniref:Uncharacterized protein n=1 Tax=Stutzerimonas stutzeri TaxID=316 RepID=A0A2N8SXK2_STUST|nr:hypothetical protein [Stutzerimonas stutzeri]MCQ4325588.1 hypothetical protein [Stutzerimonas stutzeri]PNG07216.1 hypothetical protein CXK94_17465 [Stutzerimonas stutzeri]